MADLLLLLLRQAGWQAGRQGEAMAKWWVGDVLLRMIG